MEIRLGLLLREYRGWLDARQVEHDAAVARRFADERTGNGRWMFLGLTLLELCDALCPLSASFAHGRE